MNNYSNMDMMDYQNALAEQSQEYNRRAESIARQKEDNRDSNNITTSITEPLGAEFIREGVGNVKTYVKGGVRKVVGKGVKKVASNLGVKEEDVDDLLKGRTQKITKSLVNRGSKALKTYRQKTPLKEAGRRGGKVRTVEDDFSEDWSKLGEPEVKSAFDTGGEGETPVLDFFKSTATQDPKTLLDDDDDDTPLSLQQPKTLTQDSGTTPPKADEEQDEEEESSKASVKAQEKAEGKSGLGGEGEEDLEGADLGADEVAGDEAGLNPIADLIALGLGIATAVEGADSGSKKPIVAPPVSSASTQFGV